MLETNRDAQRKQENAGVVDKTIPWTSHFARNQMLASERHYWSKNKFLVVREVQDVMPRNRYLKVNQYLHFNDSDTAVPRGEANHDKLHQIRPILTKLGETFEMEYWPNRKNATDEAME